MCRWSVPILPSSSCRNRNCGGLISFTPCWVSSALVWRDKNPRMACTKNFVVSRSRQAAFRWLWWRLWTERTLELFPQSGPEDPRVMPKAWSFALTMSLRAGARRGDVTELGSFFTAKIPSQTPTSCRGAQELGSGVYVVLPPFPSFYATRLWPRLRSIPNRPRPFLWQS